MMMNALLAKLPGANSAGCLFLFFFHIKFKAGSQVAVLQTLQAWSD